MKYKALTAYLKKLDSNDIKVVSVLIEPASIGKRSSIFLVSNGETIYAEGGGTGAAPTREIVRALHEKYSGWEILGATDLHDLLEVLKITPNRPE
jgi:hypothetical protein